MPERLALFRVLSQAGADGAQAQHQQQLQQQHQQQHQQQRQEEQRRVPASATLGTLPTAATPKCWAVVQTPLETLYDDDEEESEDSGYFSQLGTTAITPIYSEAQRRSSATAAATSESAAAAAGCSLVADGAGGLTARGAGGAGAGEEVPPGFRAPRMPQHTRSEPHAMMWHSSSRTSVPQATGTTLGAGAAGPGDSMDAAAGAGARECGSGTSSRRPLLRLKTSSSVPNIQSHFKNRTLLRRPRSRNANKEDSLQRETAFWGGDLFSDANGDEQEDQPSVSTSSGKLCVRKESYSAAGRLSVGVLGCLSSSTSSNVNSRALTSPLMAFLYAGVGDGGSTQVHSCEEGEAAGSAHPSSRLTSAGGAGSVGTTSSLSTQQQPLLTPRSQPHELPLAGDKQDWQSTSFIEGSTQQEETPPVLSPQAASEGVPLYCRHIGSQSTGNLAKTPTTGEQSAGKEMHRGGVPLLRRSLFHPFRKHVSVTEGATGGSCPDFRSTHNTFGNTPSPAGSVTGGGGSRRNSGLQQVLQYPAGKAATSGRSSAAGLPPLPHQQRHSRSGGDLRAGANATTAAICPGAAKPLTEVKHEAGMAATGEPVALADVPTTSSSFGDAATRAARDTKAASSTAAVALPRSIVTTGKVWVADRAAAATAGERTGSIAQQRPMTLPHQPPRPFLYKKGRNNPAAAGAAAAAAMHVAGFAATASASGVASAPTLPGLSAPVQVLKLQGSAAGPGRQGGAAFSAGAGGAVLPSARAAARDRGLPAMSACATTSVATVPAAAEDGASAAVGGGHSSSNSTCSHVDGGSAAGSAAATAGAAAASSALADCRNNSGTISKGTGGVGGMHRSASLNTLSKKLSIRALMLRGSTGGSATSGPGGAAGASPPATLASTPPSAASSSHSIVSQAIEQTEEDGVAAADFAVKRGILRQQQQPNSHDRQQPQQQQPEEALHSPVRAFEALQLSRIPAVPEENPSTASRGSSSFVGRQEAAASVIDTVADKLPR